MLRRLDGYDLGRRRLRVSGELLYQYSPTLHTVIERKARVVRRTVTVHLPLDNLDRLEEFLDRASAESASVPRTPASERASQCIDREIAPIGRSLPFLAKVPGLAVSCARRRRVDGTLEGFVEIGGKHYPEYTYRTPEGLLIRAVDRDAAVEDLVDEEMAMRILRRRYPRDVEVRIVYSQ